MDKVEKVCCPAGQATNNLVGTCHLDAMARTAENERLRATEAEAERDRLRAEVATLRKALDNQCRWLGLLDSSVQGVAALLQFEVERVDAALGKEGRG